MHYGGRNLAPIRTARLAADSAAPWFFGHSIIVPLFSGTSTSLFADHKLVLPEDVRDFSRKYDSVGPTFGNDNSGVQARSIEHPTTNFQRSGISEITLIVWFIPTVAVSTEGNFKGLWQVSDSNSWGWRFFLNTDSVEGRLRFPEVGGGQNIDLAYSASIGDVIRFAGVCRPGSQKFRIDNKTTGEEFSTEATNASFSISIQDAFSVLGNRDDGTGGRAGTNSAAVNFLYAYAQFRTWSDAELEHNKLDSFAPFRPRTLLIPVSSGGAKTITVGQATETDTAQPVTANKAHSIGQAVETDTAQTLGFSKALSVGLATESDTAFSITAAGGKNVSVGLTTETDTAQAVTAAKNQSVGQATETDTAQSVTAVKAKSIGLAAEVDTAQLLSSSKLKAIGQATETDTALSVTPVKTFSLGQATETDTANSITHSKSVTVGQAQETDTAFPVTVTGGATALGLIPRNRLFLKNVDKMMDY